MAVTLRVSKLPVFKVRLLRDLNPGLPRESLIIGKLTYPGSPGSNPKTGNFEALKVTAMYFTFLESSNLPLFGGKRVRMREGFKSSNFLIENMPK